ncbi:ferredoxin reductase family protein [Marinomonas sp. S3726]|uniref:ferredoxin reductase family protein n=1 Tax=Marinomonas sp. S3726 TaxID=579484 RepID=UPI000698869D|nr:ferredoxin reductase family protein [Marinomonas sp. S3726]
MFIAICILITTCLIIPGLGVMQSYSGVPMDAAFSQYLGIVALLGMSYCYILATRFKLVESLFGGLDKSYVFHKWLGLGSLAVIFLHDQIDAEIKSLGSPSMGELAEDLGGLGFDGLQVLLLITVITLIPYALWKFTHKFIGVLFVLSVLHFAWMPKPFDLTSPLGLYVLSICGLGILSYLYTLSSGFARASKSHNPLKGTRQYKVISKDLTGDIVSFELAPIQKGIRHQAGQFSFISFDHAKLKEIHPFTISKAPNQEGNLRFSIKALGDYTKSLPKHLEIGITANVSKAYGHFGKKLGKRNEVWIAAGIGITPFVAMAQALSEQKESSDKETHLFYCVQSKQQAIHLEELEKIAARCSRFHVHLCESSLGKRISLNLIKESIGFELKKASISFCGPSKLRKTLQDWFKSESVPSRNFHYEVFEIRSGIGLNPIVSWILKVLLARFPKIKQVWARLPFTQQ